MHLHEHDRDISTLHPAIRENVRKIQAELKKANNPLEVFEAFRSPQRQAMLAAKRPKVTWVGPWGSMHQYGLAVDFVIRKPNGGWSWDDSGENAKYWTQMHEIALANGMTPLYNKNDKLIEKPHVQLIGASTAKLRKGLYPEGGDAIWAERLAAFIDSWGNQHGAPPRPEFAAERPPLDPNILAEMESAVEMSDKILQVIEQTRADECFQKLNTFITRSEGGFVDHPDDKGGATNMGITIHTLAEWRGCEVSVDDVRALTREEADAILWRNYYAACRCTEMPERMAMVIYNCAVLSGHRRAIEFAQKAFNALGLTVNHEPLEVDGVLGRLTMGAIRAADPSILAEAFIDEHEAYLRERDNFDVFGKGWLNRIAALRAFVNTLPRGTGIRPKNKMKISESKFDVEDILDLASSVRSGDKRGALANVLEILLEEDGEDRPKTKRRKDLLNLLVQDRLRGDKTETTVLRHDPITVVNDIDGKPPLTPVNAALGTNIGKLMNGKKSVTGILGLLLTILLPKIDKSGELYNFLTTNGDILITLFSLLTGWGFLGKIDKAIRLVGVVR